MNRRLVPFLCALALASPAAAAVIQGRIIADHSGSPVPSASVRIHKTGQRELAADLETDGEGRFTAAELDAGEYRIEISKPNHVDATLRVSLSSPGLPLLIRLIRCAIVTGRVADAQGHPVTGTSVYAIPRVAGRPLRPDFASGRYARVNADGQYRLFNLPPGQYAVAASFGASTLAMGSTGRANPTAAGSGVQYFPDNARPQFFTVAGGEEFRADFAVAPSALYSVTGQIQLPAPKTRYWLALAAIDQPAIAAAVAIADEEGKFRFEGVAQGSYHLFASGPSRARGGRGAILEPDPYFTRTRVDVSGQNVEGITIAPGRGRIISFVLRGSGCAPSGQMIMSSTEDWGTVLEKRATLALGKTEILSWLAPSTYTVSVTGLGDNCFVEDSTVDLSYESPADPLVITALPAGTIRGKLLTGGRPTSEFTVVLMAVGVSEAAPAMLVSVPDSQGQFSFGGLRPGRYRIGARSAAQRPALFEIEVPGGSVTEVELPVAKDGTP